MITVTRGTCVCEGVSEAHLRGAEEVRDRALAAAPFQHRAAVAARAVLLQQHGADGGVAQPLSGHLVLVVPDAGGPLLVELGLSLRQAAMGTTGSR